MSKPNYNKTISGNNKKEEKKERGNLFTGSALNALDLYIKYIAEVVLLRTYIVWFTSVQM